MHRHNVKRNFVKNYKRKPRKSLPTVGAAGRLRAAYLQAEQYFNAYRYTRYVVCQFYRFLHALIMRLFSHAFLCIASQTLAFSARVRCA